MVAFTENYWFGENHYLPGPGSAVLVISQDLDELMTISNRIAAICAGVLSEAIPTGEASVEHIGLLMGGLHDLAAEGRALGVAPDEVRVGGQDAGEAGLDQPRREAVHADSRRAELQREGARHALTFRGWNFSICSRR